MMNIVIDFLICIFEIYVFYDFLHDILEKRTENKLIIITALGIMSVMMCGINRLQISQINLVAILFLFLLGTVLLFCGNLKIKISYFLIFYVIMAGMEFVVGIFCIIVTSSEFLATELYPFKNFIFIIITKLMSYVVLRLIKLFLNR